MNELYVNMKEQDKSIADLFKTDLVSVGEILDTLDEILYEKNSLEEELKEKTKQLQEYVNSEYEKSIPEIHGKGISW